MYFRSMEIFQKIGEAYNIQLQESNYEKDHLNFLVKAKPDTSLLKFINSFKSASSRLIKKVHPEIKKKLWKEVFLENRIFISTTGGTDVDTIWKYIERQQRK